jgi:Protein of unknown function (DUF2637)
VSGRADRWIGRTTIACVGMLAIIAGTVSYLHMHVLVEIHGQPGWVAALTPISVDERIVAASTTLLAESRSGSHGGLPPWALLVVGSAATLAANVAVAEPTDIGRMVAAWPSLSLIAAYELLMGQVRRAAESGVSRRRPGKVGGRPTNSSSRGRPDVVPLDPGKQIAGRGREPQMLARQWALANRPADGSLPSDRDIAGQHGRHERWGRLVKRSGLAGELERQGWAPGMIASRSGRRVDGSVSSLAGACEIGQFDAMALPVDGESK